jgi:hypothetical protein
MHIFTHYKLHRRTHFSITTTNYYLLYSRHIQMYTHRVLLLSFIGYL